MSERRIVTTVGVGNLVLDVVGQVAESGRKFADGEIEALVAELDDIDTRADMRADAEADLNALWHRIADAHATINKRLGVARYVARRAALDDLRVAVERALTVLDDGDDVTRTALYWIDRAMVELRRVMGA